MGTPIRSKNKGRTPPLECIRQRLWEEVQYVARGVVHRYGGERAGLEINDLAAEGWIGGNEYLLTVPELHVETWTQVLDEQFMARVFAGARARAGQRIASRAADFFRRLGHESNPRNRASDSYPFVADRPLQDESPECQLILKEALKDALNDPTTAAIIRCAGASNEQMSRSAIAKSIGMDRGTVSKRMSAVRRKLGSPS